MAGNHLRDRAVLDLLVERVLPPFDPPPAGPTPLGALMGLILAAGLLIAGITGQGDGDALPGVLVCVAAGGLAITVAALLRRRRAHRRRQYLDLYATAYERAQRLLAGTGRPEWGDSEARLAQDVRALHQLRGE